MNETPKREARDQQRVERPKEERHNGGATPPPRETEREEEGHLTESAQVTEGQARPSLVDRNGQEGFQARWHAVQMDFVDEPRAAVERADALVAEVIDYLSEALAAERETVKRAWSQEDETEELRLALQDYRALFDHLISI